MHDTLTLVAHTKVGQPEILDILLQCRTLKTGIGLFDEIGGILEVLSRAGGNILPSRAGQRMTSSPEGPNCALFTYVVDSHQGAVRPADLAAGILETLEGLGRGHLVDKMAI